MDIVLENDFLRVGVKIKGAELASVFHKKTNLEYMWGADPAFWGKSSPVLFPIVGTLKGDVFHYEGKSYSLPRHGFARDYVFEIERQERDRAIFLLRSSDAMLEKYPFEFELRLHYQLAENNLQVTYDVKNSGDGMQYFSIGGHPAFKVPLVEGARYEDYFLEFQKKETAGRWPLAAGLVKTEPTPLLNESQVLPLTRALFSDDAVVLKHLRSTRVSLKSRNDSRGLDFNFEGFPFLGIWAAPNANFVCIEPWCGIADSVNHNQDFVRKEGIEKIAPGQRWEKTWSVRFY